MDIISLSNSDRLLIQELTKELKRFNDISQNEKDRLLSIQEAAEFSGRTRQTISRKIREGVIKKVTRGCSTGILLSELKKVN